MCLNLVQLVLLHPLAPTTCGTRILVPPTTLQETWITSSCMIIMLALTRFMLLME
jgi:hypothetical protein